jgi:hypothetical protein
MSQMLLISGAKRLWTESTLQGIYQSFAWFHLTLARYLPNALLLQPASLIEH